MFFSNWWLASSSSSTVVGWSYTQCFINTGYIVGQLQHWVTYIWLIPSCVDCLSTREFYEPSCIVFFNMSCSFYQPSCILYPVIYQHSSHPCLVQTSYRWLHAPRMAPGSTSPATKLHEIIRSAQQQISACQAVEWQGPGLLCGSTVITNHTKPMKWWFYVVIGSVVGSIWLYKLHLPRLHTRQAWTWSQSQTICSCGLCATGTSSRFVHSKNLMHWWRGT